jgi:hypothetical protein
VEKAGQLLLSGELCVSLPRNGALVTSNNGSYFVNGHCECAAARKGRAERYHRAAVRIVELAETMPEAPAQKSQDATSARVPSRIVRSASWFGRRDGNAMWLNGWQVRGQPLTDEN